MISVNTLPFYGRSISLYLEVFMMKLQKSVWLTVVATLISFIFIYMFATEELIDRRQLLAGSSVHDVLLNQVIQIVWALFLIVVIYFMTRKREIPNIAERAPEKKIALREVIMFLVYGGLVLVGGQWLGEILHIHGLGMHLHGSFFGSDYQISAKEVLIWMSYNFTFYVIIPFIYVRKKKYTLTSLNLRSSNWRKDLLLIVVVLSIECVGQLSLQDHIFELSLQEFLVWGSISFVIHVFGTVIPIMFFVYGFLINRFYRLTGSVTTTTILGGLMYVLYHLFEYWTLYESLETSLFSLGVVFLQFIGPGMVKSYLTLRTGNAWVHAWSYHAIAPHVVVDTPHIMHYFRKFS